LAALVTCLAKKHFHYHGKVVHRDSTDSDYLVDNPNRRCPSIDKARQDLGYDPQIPLEEGMLRSLIWYSENREAEEA
jgi:UDP-glucuronate decarboxylase